jgi:hypothetical protein
LARRTIVCTGDLAREAVTAAAYDSRLTPPN